MLLKEYVAHEVEKLGEEELQAVAEYVSFLKFRSRTSLEEMRLASLYDDFEKEDRALAEQAIEDYAPALTHEDKD